MDSSPCSFLFILVPVFFMDGEVCKTYKAADCSNKPSVVSVCKALCQCQGFKCVNNGQLVVSSQQQCKCICSDDYTGDQCEKSVCYDQAFCNTFGVSYCSFPIVSGNCPKLCGLCSD